MYSLEKINFANKAHSPACFFRSIEDAVDHILDHLLTANECYYWLEKQQSLRDYLPVDGYEERFSLAKELIRSPKHTRPFYQAYRRQVQKVVHQAEQCTGWLAETEYARLYFGIEGIIAVFSKQENALLTAYLAGAGNPLTIAATELSSVIRRYDPLPRETRPDKNKMIRKHVGSKTTYNRAMYHKAKPHTQRDNAFNDSDYAWLCFIKASQFVRNQSKMVSCKQRTEGFQSNDLHALRMVIPDRRMKFEDWFEYYKQCQERGLS